VLKKYGYTRKQDKVYLQCFDANELKRIKHELEPKMGMDLKLVQLIAYTDWNETRQRQADGKWVNYSYDWMFKPGAMAQIAQYADGIGPDYHMLVAEGHAGSREANGDGERGASPASGGASVYRPRRPAADYVTDVNQLFDLLYNQADVDGLFTDFPDKAVQFLAKH
jgi:glycerophosphoryl diester phosphodiesterase